MDDKIGAVVGKLQQRLGDDYEVRIVDVTKNNDTVKKGISVRKNGEKIGRIYYWNGEALEAFLDDVESSPLPDIDFEMSLKKQKDNIVAILINAEANKERLKSMTETLNDMMKESQDIVEDIPETLFILSNETRQFGAICMLYPEVLKKDGFSQKEIGKIDDITPAGWAFYHANTIQAQQECFLRGLVVQMEPLGERETYSPLRWVLKIMFDLFERTGDYKINYIEFAVCVQTSSPKYELETVVNKILEIRGRRKKCINKKKFDRDLIHNAWKHYFKEEKNFHEYADMNLRYLSASGILKRSGRGITVMPEYKSLAYELTKNVISDATLKERYKLLCQGAPLPTDNTEIAKKVLEDLINELEMYNIKYEIPDITLDNSKNINIVRSNLKQNIDHYKEEKYAQNQRECWYEIYEYMKLLISNNGKSKELGEDYIINVPKAEAAAYLEWILWRAFLAIDHIVNKPYDARGFNVDQDYLPIGTAPGGKPDMIFEFDDYVIVVEVTLSTNSRQEAMEGEPVRRHVADLVQKYKKPVYGLFVANKIDSNTAETFRMGVWYTTQDERLELHIVPLTLTQFSEYFKFIFTENFAEPQKIVDLMCNCENYRKICEGPEWKKCINEVVQIMTKG